MTAPLMLDIKNLGKRFPARGRARAAAVDHSRTCPFFGRRRRAFSPSLDPPAPAKSTLLNIIAQIDTASGGEIVFDRRGSHHRRRAEGAASRGLNRRIRFT